MSLIIPYSTLAKPVNLAQTAANFPSCKHFWDCRETSGTTLTDIINGVVLTGMNGPSFGTGWVKPNGTVSPTVVGNLVNPLTSQCLLIAVGQFNGGLFRLGKLSTGAIQLIQSGIVMISDAAGTGAPVTSVAYTSSASDMSRVVYVDAWNSATGLKQIECDTSTTYTLKNTAETNQAPGITTFSFDTSSAAWGCPGTVSRLYGAAFFVFAGNVPSDVKPAIAWMTKQWTANNKAIYPGWAGIA